MRTGIATDDDMYSTLRSKPKTPQPVSRSKTIMGRKLRSMTVEKGLLRETKVVHKMIDTLVECRVCFNTLLHRFLTDFLSAVLS
jgi:phosphatidylinositol-binding clathrin assembly protein